MGVYLKVKRPAIFLDRDGTIIEQIDVLTDPSQLTILPGAAEAIAALKERSFLIIGITNQPIIEKGFLTEEGLQTIHTALQQKLGETGASLDAIYACPHQYHEEGQCACRKPGIGLIENALTEFPRIDMKESWFIGDRLRDVKTGWRAKLKTILVATGGPSTDDAFFPDAIPDHSVKDLKEAAELILR